MPEAEPRSQGEVAQEKTTLSEKVDRLFRLVRPSGRREYTYQQVADALAERGGPSISATYLWQLRKGHRDNPTKRHLQALANFFGVKPEYFFDHLPAQQPTDEELQLMKALRDPKIRHLVTRASGLSERASSAVLGILDHIRALEGLPHATVNQRDSRTSLDAHLEHHEEPGGEP